MPPVERPLTAAECYRFCLSNPSVDLRLTGPRTAAEMAEAAAVLSSGPLTDEEMARVRRIGDQAHG